MFIQYFTLHITLSNTLYPSMSTQHINSMQEENKERHILGSEGKTYIEDLLRKHLTVIASYRQIKL